jgi:hypothetical protein
MQARLSTPLSPWAGSEERRAIEAGREAERQGGREAGDPGT